MRKRARATRPKEDEFVYLEPDELRRVLEAARAVSLRNYLLLLLGYNHGMRASELCDLRVSDIDLTDRTILIRRLKQSNSTRQELTDAGFAALTEYLGSHSGSDLLFPSRRPVTSPKAEDGQYQRQPGALGRRAIYQIFRDAAVVAGMSERKRHPHCLKHTLGTLMAQKNAPLHVIARALGHRSISSTMKYIEVSDRQADAARRAALTALELF